MRLVEEVVEEEREETSEKVEEEEEEREVITVREALALSISSEKNLTTKCEPGMELEGQDNKQSQIQRTGAKHTLQY